MVVFVSILTLAGIGPLLVGVPEALGLLAFGIGLAAAAGILRSFLAREQGVETEAKLEEKV